MDRDEAAEFIVGRYGAYVTAVGKAPTADGLRTIIDDALNIFAMDDADLASLDSVGEQQFKAQLAYRAIAQLTRDLGTTFDVTTSSGASFRLNQQRAAAEKDLQEAKEIVLAMFGTLGPVLVDSSPFITLSFNRFGGNPLRETIG